MIKCTAKGGNYLCGCFLESLQWKKYKVSSSVMLEIVTQLSILLSSPGNPHVLNTNNIPTTKIPILS